MKLIFIRHGQTNENAAHCYLGHYDAPLNETGRKQLFQLADQLKGKISTDKGKLYSSDLSRTMESAQIIGSALQLKPIPVVALRELDFGNWDCKTYEMITENESEWFEKWIHNPLEISPPNGETLHQLGVRFDKWLNETLLHKEETILVVSHGGPIRWFLSKWVQQNENEFWNVKGIKLGKGIIVEFDTQTRTFHSVRDI
ncbi:histidine phosphatase family protein [Ectobacillus sp. sgz5001026]|uniref:histidine phosphatase family protein n=1 Tax=Ectobacillus sp. sgz5001026 TaxID=3242473 RepID=UPI0036D373DD